ncbi:MAG: type IV pilus twitching motility protein PilT [Vulcanimicrobiaceae bacterium]
MSDLLAPMRLGELLQLARLKNASDLHVSPGLLPALRIDGRLEQFGSFASARDCEILAEELLDASAQNRLRTQGDASIAHRAPQLGSFRVHAYRTVDGISFAIRLLAASIPTLESLHLPAIIKSFAQRQNGLVIFSGPTGSGKTTSLAALVDRINRNDARHIMTVEDPIEYEHVSRKSIISQREVGRDVVSFAGALMGALRSDPDVILVGEMRDAATMRAVLTAAETGHLVFATLHTGDSPQTIDRIIDAFSSDSQQQVRVQLSQTLIAVVCQRLVPRLSGAGRRAAVEILLANDAVRNLIRDSKTHQIRNVIATGKQFGMHTLEDHLSELVMRREVSFEAAQGVTDRPSDVRSLERSLV